ncbi:unnamed protein product [Sphagnum troendelagicum]
MTPLEEASPTSDVATLTWPKCGGEAQHLEKLGIWSPPGLPNVQSSTAGPKTPRIGFDYRPLKVGNRPLPEVRIGSAIRRWKDLDEGYNFGSDLVAIQARSRELWRFKVPGVPPGRFRDNFGTPFRESREFVPLGCSPHNVAQRIL